MPIRWRPDLTTHIANSPRVRAAVEEAARRAAREAERIGRGVSRSYRTRVDSDSGGVRVVAATERLSAAGWIEFGTATLPASAPLRRGAEAAGLRSPGQRP